MAGTVAVRGLQDLSRAFRVADQSLKKNLRGELREIGRPVAELAQKLAIQEISGLSRGRTVDWSQTRLGVTQKLVYVAPKQRGRRSRQNEMIRRPNLKSLLLDKAYDPALDTYTERTVTKFERLLDKMAQDWENA